jgi:K+-sensing histidine kinase KdpD
MAGAVGTVVVATVLIPVRDSIGAASVALALVLVVVGAAAAGGRVAAAVASAAAALSFNFLHAAPLYTFHLRNTADVVTSVLMILVGIAVGEVAVRRFRTAWRGSSVPERRK